MTDRETFIKEYVPKIKWLLSQKLPERASSLRFKKEAYEILEQSTRTWYYDAYCSSHTLKKPT